jgi:hypothetical protein
MSHPESNSADKYRYNMMVMAGLNKKSAAGRLQIF